MRRMNLQFRSDLALAAALIVGIGIPITAAAFINHAVDLTFWAGALMAVAISTGAMLAWMVAGDKAILSWWTILLLAWIWLVGVAILDGGSDLMQSARFVPERFAFWSVPALPSFLATMLLLWKSKPGSLVWVCCIVVFWGMLAAVCGRIASFALDVGGTPLDDPLLVVSLAVPAWLLPFFCCWFFITRAFRRGNLV